MKKRRCFLVILALVIVFGSVSVVSAYTGSATVYVSRINNTSARVSASITFNTTVTSCTTKITLQERYNGSWRTATGVPVRTISKTQSKVRTMTLPYTVTLVKGKIYRIKATYTSKKGSSGVNMTAYSATF